MPGSVAADHLQPLLDDGISFKWCQAGTVGEDAYHIVHFGQCPDFKSFPANKFLDPQWEDRACQALLDFLGMWQKRRTALIYCVKGANRSAAMVLLLFCVCCRCTVEEVASSSNTKQQQQQQQQLLLLRVLLLLLLLIFTYATFIFSQNKSMPAHGPTRNQSSP